MFGKSKEWLGWGAMLFLAVSGAASWILIIWAVINVTLAFSVFEPLKNPNDPRFWPQRHAAPPPAAYNYKPSRPYVIHEHADIRRACWSITGISADACAIANQGGTCVIHMRRRQDVARPMWLADLRHEWGHCNGWQHHAPAARQKRQQADSGQRRLETVVASRRD